MSTAFAEIPQAQAPATAAPVKERAVAVEMKAVEKYYGKFRALNGIDLEVRRGEKIVICGPSGSGKSTLIRTINRLEPHDAGRIVVNGVELDGTPPRPRTSAWKSAWCSSSSISSRTSPSSTTACSRRA